MSDSTQGERRTTLLVVIDDEQPIRGLVERVLGQRFEVRVFASAEDFEAPDEPHILIVDKNLPGMSGLELVERHHGAGPPFEAIMITGYADMESALRAMQLGIYSYLRKPVQLEELLTSVAGAQERLRQRQGHPLQPSQPLLQRVRELEGTVAELSNTLSSLRRSETELLNERLVSLGQVTASVTHELNNILTYVMGNFELLSQRLPALLAGVETLRAGGSAEPFFAEHGRLLRGALYEELPAFMQQTRDGLQLIRQLCEDLRGLSRVSDQGRVLDAREAAQTAIRMAGAVVRRNIELDIAIGDEPLPVRGNRGRLVQAMINLLLNAAEAIDPQQQRPRRIDLALRRSDSRVVIEVSDTGRGVPKKYLHDIFKPFVTFKKDGTGLGLPLVQSIVDQLRGELTFHSEVDRGTRVAIYLPLAGEDWPSGKTGRLRFTVGSAAASVTGPRDRADDTGSSGRSDESAGGSGSAGG